ncbi:MAG: hypothetical protein IPP40_13105 [bacterium]|nr:hypothetical protein [bacterium]
MKAFGNKLYCANGFDGLIVLDIANPAAPALIGNYSTLRCLAEVARHENNLLIHDEGGEIRDYEWETNGSLAPGNVLVDVGYFTDFFVNDNGLFVLDDNVLASYDISNRRIQRCSTR